MSRPSVLFFGNSKDLLLKHNTWAASHYNVLSIPDTDWSKYVEKDGDKKLGPREKPFSIFEMCSLLDLGNPSNLRRVMLGTCWELRIVTVA